jgi:hypothetical protein
MTPKFYPSFSVMFYTLEFLPSPTNHILWLQYLFPKSFSHVSEVRMFSYSLKGYTSQRPPRLPVLNFPQVFQATLHKIFFSVSTSVVSYLQNFSKTGISISNTSDYFIDWNFFHVSEAIFRSFEFLQSHSSHMLWFLIFFWITQPISIASKFFSSPEDVQFHPQIFSKSLKVCFIGFNFFFNCR